MRVRRRKAAEPNQETPVLVRVAPPDEGLLAGVLTKRAVLEGYMPPEGTSGLPASIEAGVPPEYRYWTAPGIEDSRATRDALVESCVFKAESLLLVDGQPRRVVEARYLAEVESKSAPLALRKSAVELAGVCLAPTERVPVLFEAGAAPVWTEIPGLYPGSPWLAAYADTPALRADLAKESPRTVFCLATRPGLVFVSDSELDSAAPLAEPVQLGSAVRAVKAALCGRTRLLKSEVEERFVLGVVLVPDEEDSQRDVYSEDEVRKAAHYYMEHYSGQLGLQHGEIVTGRLRLLESYVAPVEFVVSEVLVKKGTWLLAFRAVDDEIWQRIKSGELTGLSIGGDAFRTPELAAP